MPWSLPTVRQTEVVYPSVARTTHTTSRDYYSGGSRSLRVHIDIDAFSGTSITFTVQYYDSGTGEYFTLLASAALSATGQTVLQVGPDIAASANAIAQTYLPERIRVVPSGTITSVTYSLEFVWGWA